ncbi:hypothetical protein [Blastopirellula marina]|uniref:Uncharacterized protein n=1 Tax=Blastopirellula marina TaxID=124 RepID=A0A2S8G0I3_9BACT|nr:hypothetical protein [Blastopirellula marina]PQO37955.1 hypothetical protein C5Y98_07625 [Blastopirellula marina]PTL44611.1 hypothetical protein C5Y97_07625 [Blastopirellula marina]
MGRTFVTIDQEHGFWVNDSFLELALRLLLLHLEHSPGDDAPCHAIRKKWHLASTGFFNGHVPDALDFAVSTEEGRAATLKAMRSLVNGLNDSPELLSKDVLNLLWQDQYCEWGKDVETRMLLEVVHAMIGLVEGGISTTAMTSDGLPRPPHKRLTP